MITYNRSAFGLNLLFRFHGSAVYRAILPSLISVGVFLAMQYVKTQFGPTSFGEELGHPYAVGVLVASTTFLIVFRANQGYSRYWEAAGATHHMMSKWMDASIHAGVFHLQCSHYDKIKPPSFFDFPELNHLYLTRDRERGLEFDSSDDEDSATDSDGRITKRGRVESLRRYKSKRADLNMKMKKERSRRKTEAVIKSINYVQDSTKQKKAMKKMATRRSIFDASGRSSPTSTTYRPYSTGDMDELDLNDSQSIYTPNEMDFFEKHREGLSMPGKGKPIPLYGRPRVDGNWGALFGSNPPKATFADPELDDIDCNTIPKEGFASIQGGRTPPLFLQELAHLSSLLVAVALCTLRNDIDGAESPLSFYEPGSDWPTLDPDLDECLKAKGFVATLRRMKYSLGMGRSPAEQTRYNALRPLPVIGGVSDAEIHFLQMARGPYAKTMLAWNWLSEFITREHLAGSLGNVGPPIISRLIQFLGDGMIYYNHARKIMFIPFPFVHAQLSVLFVVVIIPLIPFLMDQYVDNMYVGALLTFLTVLGLAGTHEVARELENPFRNVPNEIPLVNMQAQYNEALITMYSGYHPDLFWDADRVLKKQLGEAPDRQDSTISEPTTTSAQVEPAQVDDITREEIANLRHQLAVQAKLIEQLAAKVDFDPVRESENLDKIQDTIMSNTTAMNAQSSNGTAASVSLQRHETWGHPLEKTEMNGQPTTTVNVPATIQEDAISSPPKAVEESGLDTTWKMAFLGGECGSTMSMSNSASTLL